MWFGVLAGLVEGPGLLLFQSVNWARWGPTLHASREIIWISVLMDVVLFSVTAAVVCGICRWLCPQATLRAVVFALTVLTIYDWLTVTGRLYRGSSLLFALGVSAAFSAWTQGRPEITRRFWKRSLPWAIAAAVLAAAGVQGSRRLEERHALAGLPAPDPHAPNVLVIVIDTLRADHVSAYGYPRPTTPNLDRLAREGVLFENAIAPCSWSLPSHASLVTGRYQFEHGVANLGPVPVFGWGRSGLGGQPTLGEALEKRGYRTGAFSANRGYFTRDLGFGRGFSRFEDYFHSPEDMFLRSLYGREFAHAYLTRTDHSLVRRMLAALGFTALLDRDTEGWESHRGPMGIRKRADVVNAETLRWISADTHRPFFAFLNYMDVHSPYGVPEAYHPQPAWGSASDVDRYDAGVQYADAAIGRLLRGLADQAVLQNTLVIVTSDHGESLGQHGLTYHASTLLWELVHVPLIFWLPGTVPVGVRPAVPVSNVAIAGTVLGLLEKDLLGKTGTKEFPLPSLAALWGREPPVTWPEPISELARNDIMADEDKRAAQQVPTALDGSMKALVAGRWHLIVHETRGSQLYDWHADRAESLDLARTAEGQAAQLALRQDLNEALHPRR